MKKSYILYTIIAVILVVSVIYYFYNNYSQNDLSNEDILDIIDSEVNDYCAILEENANSSTCATCSGTGEYYLVNNFSDGKYKSRNYILNKLDEGYFVKLELPIIYGWNTRSGTYILSFNIDEEGNVLNKPVPTKSCL